MIESTFQPSRWLKNPHVQSILASSGLRAGRARKLYPALQLHEKSRIIDCGNGARYRVQMQSLAYARQTLCGVYYLMKNRLIANQIPLALNTLGPRIKPKFQTLWTMLGANLPNIAGQLGQIATGQISDVSAEFIMAIPDPALPGSFLGYPVLFTRGNDGVWRIYGM